MMAKVRHLASLRYHGAALRDPGAVAIPESIQCCSQHGPRTSWRKKRAVRPLAGIGPRQAGHSAGSAPSV